METVSLGLKTPPFFSQGELRDIDNNYSIVLRSHENFLELVAAGPTCEAGPAVLKVTAGLQLTRSLQMVTSSSR